MSSSYHQNTINKSQPSHYLSFKGNDVIKVNAPLAKPIETVQKSIEGTVEALSPIKASEKEKKSNKKAIAVGSSVLVITGLVALLNPKYSSKLVNKLKSWSQSAGNRFEQNKQNYLKSKFHQSCKKTIDWSIRTLEFSNNINSAKDVGFKWLCCDKKSFSSVKNKSLRNLLQKIDNGFTKIMSKAHKAITRWFDAISKKTVYWKYNSASKKMNKFEALAQQYKNKLTPAEQKELEKKLLEIKSAREVFSQQNISNRLTEQEGMMSNLERDFIVKYHAYRNGFKNKWISKSNHIDKNMTFWAEKILEPTRNKVEKQGLCSVEKLVGNGKEQKGLYNDVYTLLNEKLSQTEKDALNKMMNKASKKLRSANYSECVEYFDKKRDLILGGAPTDILTAVGGLALSGVAIATADSKEERLSRALTGGFPVIAGIGASMAFTAMLFSGVQGLLYGFLTSIGLSKLGSLADHYILGNKGEKTKPDNTDKYNIKITEVANA